MVILLGATILHGLGEGVHARVLQMGEGIWPGYAELRSDPERPPCDPEGGAAAASAGGEEEGAGADAEAEAEADAAEEGEGGDDFLDDLLGDEDEGDEEAAAAAAAAAATKCKQEHDRYEILISRITPGLRAFRGFEGAIAAFVHTGVSYLRHMLVLLLLFCAVTASALRAHIALRPAQTRLDLWASEGAMAAAGLALTVSSYFKWQVEVDSGLAPRNAGLPILWMIGFAVMTGVAVYHLVRPPEGLSEGGSKVKAFLAVPLFAVMALIGSFHFFVLESYPAGLANYLQKLTEHALLYIHVGLYVWAGMLLKRTRIAALSFDLVRPWKLTPELLAFVVVAAAAIPTAYSGASGIFVIAAGGVIYTELTRAGARKQLALAATAMSGSLGVVLSPCLLVVIVASLNKQVTTTQLYGWGWKVFLLTATLFLFASLIVGRKLPKIAAPGEAFKGSLAAMRPLLPYIGILLGLLLAYGLGLGLTLNEHTAPAMLPVILLVILAYDRRKAKKEVREDESTDEEDAKAEGYRRAIFDGTSETTGHIGALLMLMGLSVVLGGVIERGDLMAMVPSDFGSPLVAMTVLVILLVFIGMVMDPYGAVILVTVALAGIADQSGIDPVHFWMVVLVAFELGYLSPPVALNHLLTRQVVGIDLDEVHAEAEAAGMGFWGRHERILLPMSVMATALLIVAYLPLFW
ncbi:MAG: TRAP transporter large permease subunit [Deltaproteobacteria bacterium]|nr:TRAP transporter large permease subunit [Deltaproteobacteria bacterium]